ncbi:hypothetical protein NE237_001929 [Protea cynaroides]|uniref:Uncharacterized protein n=1 Tax=Protea cynaroides TaxID=273540 RepID=A0A9Q0KU12_9MAGN|nr:hypothetical protein NE237_001929 [Protea cynaroides]
MSLPGYKSVVTDLIGYMEITVYRVLIWVRLNVTRSQGKKLSHLAILTPPSSSYSAKGSATSGDSDLSPSSSDPVPLAVLPTSSQSLEENPRPLDPYPLASLVNESLSDGEDDDNLLEDSWYVRPKESSIQYYSSNEERLEVAWLAMKTTNSSSGETRFDLFVEDSSGINLTMDWDNISNPKDAVIKL